uniref:Peptidase S74 domain-containing protein n=1 Tax=viral metagenome TaxID=1070528 RepID=A0A6C0I8L9_9ZZZZ
MSVNANYNGRSPNNTSNIKYFIPGQNANLWVIKKYLNTNVSPNVYENVLTPSSSNYDNVYIPGDLFVDGSIVTPSDLILKDNIVKISSELSDVIMNLKPTQFTYKSDTQNQVHYGFIAQEFEEHLPELVTIKPNPNSNFNPTMTKSMETNNIKAINYLEVLPLLVHKIQNMQKEIDELKALIKRL